MPQQRHLSLLVNHHNDMPEMLGDDLGGHGRHVLVVDEQEVSRRLLRRRLERDGFTVSFAGDLSRVSGPVDAIVSTSTLFLELRPGHQVDDLPIVVTIPDDGADDNDLLEQLYGFGATTVVSNRDASDAVLEALWEQKPKRT